MAKEESEKLEDIFVDCCIKEFSENFFEKEIEKQKIEATDITRVVNEVRERQQQSSKCNGGIWTDIFQVLMQNHTIGDYLKLDNQNNSGVGKVLDKLYSSNLFFYFEMAQLIKYNLERLEGSSEYDFDEIERFEKYIRIDKKDSEENIIIDGLPEHLDMIADKYKNEKELVRFEKRMEMREIYPVLYLDDMFPEANFLYIANEKFRNFIYRKRNAISLEKMKDLIKYLEKDSSADMVYLWERMTNFNVLILIAEFCGKVCGNLTDRQIQEVLERYKKQIYQIEQMPNTLTRIIFLKIAFEYLCTVPNAEYLKCELRNFNQYLEMNSMKYGIFVNRIMKHAMVIRWNYGDEDAHDKCCWEKELSKEFSMKLFRQWRESLNIRNVMSHYAGKNKSRIAIITGQNDVTDEGYDAVVHNNIQELCLSLTVQDVIEKYKKTLLLSYIIQMDDDDKIAEKMLDDNWSVEFINYNDLVEAPIGDIVTDTVEETAGKIIQAKDEEQVKYYLKKEVELWRTSKLKKVMIEKIPENKKSRYSLEILMKI